MLRHACRTALLRQTTATRTTWPRIGRRTIHPGKGKFPAPHMSRSGTHQPLQIGRCTSWTTGTLAVAHERFEFLTAVTATKLKQRHVGTPGRAEASCVVPFHGRRGACGEKAADVERTPHTRATQRTSQFPCRNFTVLAYPAICRIGRMSIDSLVHARDQNESRQS